MPQTLEVLLTLKVYQNPGAITSTTCTTARKELTAAGRGSKFMADSSCYTGQRLRMSWAAYQPWLRWLLRRHIRPALMTQSSAYFCSRALAAAAALSGGGSRAPSGDVALAAHGVRRLLGMQLARCRSKHGAWTQQRR